MRCECIFYFNQDIEFEYIFEHAAILKLLDIVCRSFMDQSP